MWKKKIEKPQAKTPERALETLRWLCAKMERCEYDLKASLRRWMVDPQKWDEIIEKLRDEKFVDNSRYTRAFVGEKLRTGSWGESKIRYHLQRKEISREIIDQTLEELIDKNQTTENLTELLKRKYQSESRKTDDRYKIKTKLYRWAATRGFDSAEILKILETIINED
ncbi:MAG: regulatory protein RecX [Rikenellaceae bacterium]